MPSKSNHNHSHSHEHKLVSHTDSPHPSNSDQADISDAVGAQVRELADLAPSDEFAQSPSVSSWLFCLLIFFLGIGIFAFSLRNSSIKSTSEIVSPAPSPTQIITPTSVPSATPTMAKSSISILVLNGTGVPGLAGRVKQELENNGFTTVSTGNTTQAEVGKNVLSYKSGLEAVANDISEKLSDSYKLEVTKSLLPASSDSDIEIILGQK